MLTTDLARRKKVKYTNIKSSILTDTIHNYTNDTYTQNKQSQNQHKHTQTHITKSKKRATEHQCNPIQLRKLTHNNQFIKTCIQTSYNDTTINNHEKARINKPEIKQNHNIDQPHNKQIKI